MTHHQHKYDTTCESGKIYEELVQACRKAHQRTFMKAQAQLQVVEKSVGTASLRQTLKPSTLRLLFGSTLLCYTTLGY
jgi:hypothetical protein